jgi:hypothetical protein
VPTVPQWRRDRDDHGVDGEEGHETPTGVFTILQKNEKHKSNIYNNAPMPYMQRLTWDGIALHAGNLPGYPQSHGCVRMPMAFAENLFKSTEKGGTVVVAGKAGAIEEAPTAGVLAPIDLKGQPAQVEKLAENEEYRWNPEMSPTGPLTILISRPDRRMLVLRNGVEIGRSRIDLPAMDFGTCVLIYAPDSTGADHWIVVGVPGADETRGRSSTRGSFRWSRSRRRSRTRSAARSDRAPPCSSRGRRSRRRTAASG